MKGTKFRNQNREKEVRRKLFWGPLAVLIVPFIIGTALIIWGFSSTAMEPVSVGNLLIGLLSWLVYFWLGLYAIVELALWRNSKNVGHALQFWGALLILVIPLYIYIPLLLGGWESISSPFIFVASLIAMLSFVIGLVISLYGAYSHTLRARDVDLYRNVVVREGETIEKLTDGYSSRIFSQRYDQISMAGTELVASQWAKMLGKTGLIIRHSKDNEGITVYPTTYTGIGTFRFWTVLVHLYWLWKKPEMLTWVRVGFNGSVTVHISQYDYERISRPVAYHLLCASVADAIVTSLLAFQGGNIQASAAALLGQERSKKQVRVVLPSPAHDRSVLAVTAVSAVMIMAGISSALVAGLTSPSRTEIALTNVHMVPSNPQPDQSISVYAALAGLGEFTTVVDFFYLIAFAAFNDTTIASTTMRNIEGMEYGANLGSFPDGTEVTYVLTARVTRIGSPAPVTLTSEPMTFFVGTVHRGGQSGLAIHSVTYSITMGTDVTVKVNVTSASTIESVKFFTDFGGGWWDMTKSGNTYDVTFPNLLSPSSGITSARFNYKVAVRDVTWNTASTEYTIMEVMS